MIRIKNITITDSKLIIELISDVNKIDVYVNSIFLVTMNKLENIFRTEIDVEQNKTISFKDENNNTILTFDYLYLITEVVQTDIVYTGNTFDVPYTTPQIEAMYFTPMEISVDKEQNYTNGFTDGFILGSGIR